MEIYTTTKLGHSSNNLSWDIVLTVWCPNKKKGIRKAKVDLHLHSGLNNYILHCSILLHAGCDIVLGVVS